ncbi:T9SS type A sorting domain-containing protein [Portibacter marinus]|uniref:T9SS type A sorting domain-containing protein n=1 Tax=Portibacter marinus TaxID=2898660 RepID=UPI001F2EA840|nr:T9SS type A sorting domain-containing protein [Portibacter marinus]
MNFLDIVNNFESDSYEILKLSYGVLSFMHARYILGLMISNGDLAEARTYLTALPETHSLNRSEKDFIFTQSLVIDWLSSEKYVLSAANKMRLQSIAYQKDVLDGYARSLLHALTGELNLKDEKPLFSEESTVKNRSFSEQNITLFPNPVSNQINLEIAGTTDNKVNVTIFSISGQKIYEQSHLINGEATTVISINSEDFLPGLYGVMIRSTNGRTLHSQKISKI